MAPETAARCRLEKDGRGEGDRVGFMTSDERRVGGNGVNHRRARHIRLTVLIQSWSNSRGAREARILGPRAPVITANYGRTGARARDRLKAVFRVHCAACARA